MINCRNKTPELWKEECKTKNLDPSSVSVVIVLSESLRSVLDILVHDPHLPVLRVEVLLSTLYRLPLNSLIKSSDSYLRNGGV